MTSALIAQCNSTAAVWIASRTEDPQPADWSSHEAATGRHREQRYGAGLNNSRAARAPNTTVNISQINPSRASVTRGR